MPRYIRNSVITAKPEITPGTDSVPTGLANAILFSEMSITPLDAKNIDRNNIRGFFGANEQLVGTASVKVSFTVELAGSGAAATAPAWGALFRGCAMAEGLLAAPDRVEYTPISTALETLTIYIQDADVRHKLLGAMGTCTLTAKVGERPALKFEFIGIDGGTTATANDIATLTAWKMPVAMTMANVTDITLGCTYALGAITGGVVYPSTGLELMLGNAMQFTPLLSLERVDITNREVTGSTELELTAAQEVAFMATVKANTTQSLALTIGTVTGYQMIIHAPAVQFTNPKKVDLNSTRLIGYDLRAVPVAGNDELRIACI